MTDLVKPGGVSDAEQASHSPGETPVSGAGRRGRAGIPVLFLVRAADGGGLLRAIGRYLRSGERSGSRTLLRMTVPHASTGGDPGDRAGPARGVHRGGRRYRMGCGNMSGWTTS